VTALFGVAALNQYLRDGNRFNGVLTVSLLSTVMALHHATLMLLPWLVLAITFHLLITKQVSWQTLTVRLLLVGSLSILAMLIVIWPFWEWGRAQSIQTPIDHASRHNFLKDGMAPLLFFLPMYGPLLIILPGVLWLARNRQLFGPGLAFCVLFLLGLGDTTPLPRLFFRNGWEWLTYDRFAFWASITLLPFFGIAVIWLRRKHRKGTRTKFFLALAITSLIVGLLTTFLPLQPGTVDMRPIVDFLEQDEHSGWRYLTFGFGDQLALLSTLTTATTIDGSYHTARTLPELRRSGIGQIDTAFWFPDGLSKLDPILQKAGEHGVRWGFMNVAKYIPVLERNGWIKIKTLKDGVQVWENLNAIAPAPSQPPPTDHLASFSWGTLPMLSLITALSLGSLRVWPVQAEKALRGAYAFILGLLPLSLCFWYYRIIHPIPRERVYFIYTDALFFLAHGLVLLAVILWLTVKMKTGFSLSSLRYNSGPAYLLLPAAFCILAFVSTLWSRDWHTSLAVSLNILLIFLFILSLRNWPHAWKFVLLGFCAAKG
jgi:hypothetical protein